MNFNELHRQAEQHLGKDLVDKAEKVIKDKIERESKKPTKEIVQIEDIEFTREMMEVANEANRRLSGNKLPATASGNSNSRGAKNNSIVMGIVGEPKSDSTSTQAVATTGKRETHDDSHSAIIIRTVVEKEYLYGMFGLGLGLACIIAGVILGLNGVAGSTSWTATVLGLESKINDATPGVVIFVVGVFMIWITKPKVKMKNLRG